MTFVKNFPRERDLYVLYKGDAFPVAVSTAMQASGWQGGQAVQWADSAQDELLVTYSDGLYGGIMLWGSNEHSDEFAPSTGSQSRYGFGTLCTGSWLIATRTYERYTYASRLGGPLVENAYVVGERVRFSLRGLWTREDEFSLSGDPRAPNEFFVGSVVQVPTVANNFYITLQTSL